MAENPDKCFFNYQKSKAEDDFALKLDEWNIKYIRQYNDFRWKRAFKLDFYFPEYMSAIEINGAFKYTSTGMDDYYVERDTLVFCSSSILISNLYYIQVYSVEKDIIVDMLENLNNGLKSNKCEHMVHALI
jgi:hypothetical protein